MKKLHLRNNQNLTFSAFIKWSLWSLMMICNSCCSFSRSVFSWMTSVSSPCKYAARLPSRFMKEWVVSTTVWVCLQRHWMNSCRSFAVAHVAESSTASLRMVSQVAEACVKRCKRMKVRAARRWRRGLADWRRKLADWRRSDCVRDESGPVLGMREEKENDDSKVKRVWLSREKAVRQHVSASWREREGFES